MSKPTPPRQSWEALSRRDPAAPLEPPDGDTAEELVWRAVSAGTGKDLLDWMRVEFIEKQALPTASNEQLRWDAAQRALVQRLEKMRDHGAQIAQARTRAKAP